MQRIALFLLCLAVWIAPLPAAILEHLSLDELTTQSTAVVRARVTGSYTDFRGSLIYTHWKLQILDSLKGPERASGEVLIPGGRVGGVHQDVAGAPKLLMGKEYLLFLWTSRSGATYITGLSQGVFELSKNPTEALIVSRRATGEPMLERGSWKVVREENTQMLYSEIVSRIAAAGSSGGTR